MIQLKGWKLEIPCTQQPIGYDGENLASRIAIYTDAGPEWTYLLCMRYSDGTELTLPLTWRACVLWGELTRPYLTIPGPVQVTVQGENGDVVKKSNMGMLYVGRSVKPGDLPGGGTTDHRELDHRDAEGQHPISAIEGLEGALARIPRPMTADELRKILMNGEN